MHQRESASHGYLTRAEVDKVMRRLGKIIVEEEDSVRVYLLCSACRDKVHTLGRGEVTPPPGPMIV